MLCKCQWLQSLFSHCVSLIYLYTMYSRVCECYRQVVWWECPDWSGMDSVWISQVDIVLYILQFTAWKHTDLNMSLRFQCCRTNMLTNYFQLMMNLWFYNSILGDTNAFLSSFNINLFFLHLKEVKTPTDYNIKSENRCELKISKQLQVSKCGK